MTKIWALKIALPRAATPELLISLDENGDPITLQQQFANDITGLEKAGSSTMITYRKKGNDYYIISGTKGNNIFYHKMIIKEDAFCFVNQSQ